MFINPQDCGYFVNVAMIGLAPFVEKGKPIEFELCSRRGDSTKITFICPQKYTEEEAREAENELLKRKN